MISIREEKPQDIQAIREVNHRAFEHFQEADIVDRLRSNCENLLSLVAETDERVVGHILFSPAIIETEKKTVEGMGLAPMAVLPEYQRQGIGSALIKAGIEQLTNMPCPFVIVLGHTEYYPRFGFKPANNYGIHSEWNVPDEAFMVLVLDESKMRQVSGVAKYRPEFADAV